ncbi:TPA: DNA methyltransferase, partial [Legionella pneumophila]
MNRAQIKENISILVPHFRDKESIFQLLLAYGIPKSRVERLRNNKLNLSKRSDQIILKNKIFCQIVGREKLNSTFITLKNSSSTYKYNPRFIIVTDFQRILAEDTVQKSVLDIEIKDLNKEFKFFLPLCPGRNSFINIGKDADKIDLKAATHILMIYNNIVNENGFEINKVSLNLNRFFSRLLYCFFAEDTGLFFPKNIFTNSIGENTKENGEDLDIFFKELFEVLNKPKNEREIYHDYRDQFEYVNGGLFDVPHDTLKFSSKIRKLIIEAGGLEWSDISPDIFGSMIQHIGRPEQSMHFTSQENILKLIKPLFLERLYEELESIHEAENLEAFLNRLENIVIFDPACGSGNFLIISYKSLRKLEIEILKRLKQMSNYKIEAVSRIRLSQFYGIELEQFACEVAKSSLWIAEHQMNLKFKIEFGTEIKSLPLKDSGNIVCGNATRENWDLICPKRAEKEIYIVGNPPYIGSRNQKTIHKNDMKAVFKKNYKNLDYIACWFLKAAEYIKNIRAEAAFVSTNSICQGVQVGLLWPLILNDNLHIKFAYQSFKWTNPAKNNAGVTCVIVGLTNDSSGKKTIYSLNNIESVDSINPYLTRGNIVYVKRRSTPLSHFLPEMVYGSLLNDDGNLVLTEHEKNDLLSVDSKLDFFVKNYVG